MKKIKILGLIFCCLSLMMLVESCEKEPEEQTCDPIECNTGTQNDVSCECECPIGFTGANCEIEDKCLSQNVTCENGGTCDDGLCDCPDGFTGTNCENVDPTKVQQLLNNGVSPKVIFDGGIPLEDIYGKTFEGGYIFYLNTTDGTGLVASPTDEVGAYAYGCFGVVTSATGSTIGTGAANTVSILGACTTAGIAAEVCDQLTLGGKSDWHLASKDEMTELFNNIADSDGDGVNTGTSDINNLGDIVNSIYWTSSETDANNATNIDMSDGSFTDVGKGFSNRVRAVRAF